MSGQYTPILLGRWRSQPIAEITKKDQHVSGGCGQSIDHGRGPGVEPSESVSHPRRHQQHTLGAYLGSVGRMSGASAHPRILTDRMVAKARSNPTKRGELCGLLAVCWLATGYMAMRNGSTCQEASEAVMQDVSKFAEMMSKEIIPDKKKLTTTGPPIQAGKGKNSKAYKGKGACRWSPYHIPLTRSLESTAGVLVVRSSKQLVGWPRSSSQQSPSYS